MFRVTSPHPPAMQALLGTIGTVCSTSAVDKVRNPSHCSVAKKKLNLLGSTTESLKIRSVCLVCRTIPLSLRIPFMIDHVPSLKKGLP
jgi:hypothetical protein